jgi:hypothetical protein
MERGLFALVTDHFVLLSENYPLEWVLYLEELLLVEMVLALGDLE